MRMLFRMAVTRVLATALQIIIKILTEEVNLE